MTAAEYRAACHERCNEFSLHAKPLVRAMRYMDEEDAVSYMRDFLKLHEAMRIRLEELGVGCPYVEFKEYEVDDDE